MNRKWIVVAHRSNARVFACNQRKELSLLKEMEKPEARLGHVIEEHERQADIFAREIAAYLDHGRSTSEYEGLVLVAEKGFLGKLKGALPLRTFNKVTGTLDKNLCDLPEKTLHDQFAEAYLL